MRLTVICWLLLLVPAVAFAQAPKLQRIDVLSHGIYTGDESNCRRDSKGILRCTRTNVRLAVSTTTVPAQKGVQFGISFRAVGAPQGASIRVKRVWIFPPAGLKAPGSQKPLHRLDRDDRVIIGKTAFNTYIFDDPWELVPGTWTMEYWVGGRKLLSRSFKVVIQ